MAQYSSFQGQNSQVDAHTPIPVYRDGARTIACLKLSPEEMLEMMQTGEIWLIIEGHRLPEGIVIQGQTPFAKSIN